MFGTPLKIIVSDQADDEIGEAYAYYEKISPALAGRFGYEVDEALERL